MPHTSSEIGRKAGPLGSWPERAAAGFTLPLGVETVAPSEGLTHLNGTFRAWDLDARARPSSAPPAPAVRIEGPKSDPDSSRVRERRMTASINPDAAPESAGLRATQATSHSHRRPFDSATEPRMPATRLADRRRFRGGGTRESPRSRVLQLLKCATQRGRALESWVRDAASETAYTRFSTTTWWCNWGHRHGSHRTRRQ